MSLFGDKPYLSFHSPPRYLQTYVGRLQLDSSISKASTV